MFNIRTLFSEESLQDFPKQLTIFINFSIKQISFGLFIHKKGYFNEKYKKIDKKVNNYMYNYLCINELYLLKMYIM